MRWTRLALAPAESLHRTATELSTGSLTAGTHASPAVSGANDTHRTQVPETVSLTEGFLWGMSVVGEGSPVWSPGAPSWKGLSKGMGTSEDAGDFPPCDVKPPSHHTNGAAWWSRARPLRAQVPFSEHCPHPHGASPTLFDRRDVGLGPRSPIRASRTARSAWLGTTRKEEQNRSTRGSGGRAPVPVPAGSQGLPAPQNRQRPSLLYLIWPHMASGSDPLNRPQLSQERDLISTAESSQLEKGAPPPHILRSLL